MVNVCNTILCMCYMNLFYTFDKKMKRDKKVTELCDELIHSNQHDQLCTYQQ